MWIVGSNLVRVKPKTIEFVFAASSYHDENKLHFDELMMTRCTRQTRLVGLYKLSTLIQQSTSTGRHVDALGHIILVRSQHTCFCSYSLMLRACYYWNHEFKNTWIYVFCKNHANCANEQKYFHSNSYAIYCNFCLFFCLFFGRVGSSIA
jgi:ribosomal protein S27E